MKMTLFSLLAALLLLFGNMTEARLRVTPNKESNRQANQQLPRVHIRQLQTAGLGELEGLGGNPTEEHYPLQLCEGDCDEDSDCDIGLVCFQRDPRMAVPGCIGGDEEESRTDFCTPDPELAVTSDGTTTPSPVVSPTTGTNSTTATSSTPRPTPAPTSAPVIPVTPAPTSSSPVATATTAPLKEIEKVGNNGYPSWVYPLNECQGDCDDDEECAEGLICFHRDGGEVTPGCLGLDFSRNDYCIKDPTLEEYVPPTMAPTVATILPTASNRPSLRPSVSNVPTSAPSDFPSHVPTDLPSSMPTLSNNPTISPAPTVPPSGSPTVEPLEGIRIKLYWEEGYTWQDETVERMWCMISDYRGFPGTGKCWHGLHTEPCHQDMVYVARCDSDKRQRFSVYPMPGGTQYQIAVHNDNSLENLCLERFEYSLVLRKCNYMNPLQRFWLPRGAIFQKRFELSPITLANHCVTQAHHPKSGEVIELHKCSRARHEDHQSSFWTIY